MSGLSAVRTDAAVRTSSICAYDQVQITAHFRDIRRVPENGRVVVHFNAGLVIKIETIPTIRVVDSTEVNNCCVSGEQLTPYEKKELTHFLREYRLCPVNGRVTFFFEASKIVMIEPQF